MPRKVDPEMFRGTAAALQHAFNGTATGDDIHLGAWAAEADFAALRSQLNDPPPQYRGNGKCSSN